MLEMLKEQLQAANPILGAMELEQFEGATKMPQKYASAWSVTEKLTGASYKPLVCTAKQVSKGTNYWFIAEQTLITATPERHVVTLGVNEFGGNYTLINGSIVRIF